MASSPRPVFITDAEDAIIKAALGACERDPQNNSVDEDTLINEIQARLPFDPVRERFQKAVRFYKKRTKSSGTKPDGQLWLPGLPAPYPYEPQRLISDGQGRAVEQDKAVLFFKDQQVDRSEENFLKVQEAHLRVVREREEFRAWTLEQIDGGRPLPDINFGNCVRETGAWRPTEEPDDLEPDDDGDDE